MADVITIDQSLGLYNASQVGYRSIEIRLNLREERLLRESADDLRAFGREMEGRVNRDRLARDLGNMRTTEAAEIRAQRQVHQAEMLRESRLPGRVRSLLNAFVENFRQPVRRLPVVGAIISIALMIHRIYTDATALFNNDISTGQYVLRAIGHILGTAVSLVIPFGDEVINWLRGYIEALFFGNPDASQNRRANPARGITNTVPIHRLVIF